MPTPTVYPSAKQFLGLAKEVTQGTPVTPITATIPVDKFEPEDKPTWVDDTAFRASMANLAGRIQGVEHTEFSVEGPVFLDTLGFWVNNILGDLTFTVGPPNIHAISLLNSGTGQPGSLTLVDWQGLPATGLARVYAGACLSELTLKGNAESTLIMMSAKGLAYPSSIIGSAPTAASSTDTPYAAWRTQVGLAGIASGGTQVKTIKEWEVTIKRALKAEFTLQNAQAPYIIYRGAVDVEGKLNFSVPGDESNSILYLLNNTQPQLQILFDNGLATTLNRNLQIDCQLAAYDTAKINRGEEAVGYDTTFKAVMNSTNAGASGGLSPIKVTIKNNNPTGTY